MSKLQELINKLCPNGVEFKPLGEVCEIKRGVRVVKQELEEFGDIPVFQNSLKPLGYYKLSNFKGFTSFVIGAGAAGEIGFSEKPFWAADDCFVIISNYLNDKYIFYCLQNNQLHLKRQVRKASIPRLSRVSIEKFMIPVPPIEVQEEIVRILDSFSDYAAELQAELQARKQQYEYYRNLLLTFNPSAYGCGTDDEQIDGVTTWGGHNYKIQWKKLGEICDNMDKLRKPVTASTRISGIYPYYGASGVVDYVNNYIFDGSYLLISEDGANLLARSTPIAFSIYGKTWVNNHAHVLHFNSDVTRKFVEYFINNLDISKYVSGGAQPKLNQKKLNSIPIPIPPLELQEKIVAILDRFETLVNDLTNGLPAEIAAVKDQYEYYRNKLLTFKKLSA